MVWVTLSVELTPPDKTLSGPMAYLFVIAILALIFGSSLSIKKISDVYGFKFQGTSQAKTVEKKVSKIKKSKAKTK